MPRYAGPQGGLVNVSTWQDLRYAARNLRKSPGFAAIAILTLALGIGASTAIFSVVENVLMEPFPYADASRFMAIEIHNTDEPGPNYRGGFFGGEWQTYAQQNQVFDRVTGNHDVDVLYTTAEGTERFSGNLITPGTFEFFGMPALLGRTAQPVDYEPGAPPIFVLRYKTWVARFAADPTIINKSFTLNGTPRTLIGVMPPRFSWGDADIWIPGKPSPADAQASRESREYWYLLGHLKPGLTVPQAQADITVIAHQLATVYPKDYPKHFNVAIRSLADQVVGEFRATLLIVLAAVGLLLLIACGNVASLLLARATAREKEFAIRAALGAGRWRIVRQLLVESLLLAIGGAALGALFAWAGLRSLVAAIPPDIIPSEAVIRLNAAVLLFTLGVAAITSLLFGLAPALQATRRDLHDQLRDTGKGVGGGSRHSRMRDAVVVLEVALSLTLLVAAGLLMRSFVALRQVHLGFQSDHVFYARLPLPAERYKTAAQITSFYRPLLTRLKNLPGVLDAAETTELPPYGGYHSVIEISGKTHTDPWRSTYSLVSEGYFSALKIPLMSGRTLNEAEENSARKVIVINQTFASKYFPNDNPIGQHVHIVEMESWPEPVHDAWFEIIGVIGDIRNNDLQGPIDPEMWAPSTLSNSPFRGIILRTAKDPLAMANAVPHEIWATDRGVAITETGSLEGYLSRYSYAGPRFGFLLMTIFAAIGLILVTIGVYSVLAYTAARRTHEIGIRMALGASTSDVLKLVLRMGLRLVLIGIALGIAVTLAVGRFISSQLWGVTAHDPATLAAVAILLLVTGVVACWIPAHRAAKVDPLVALRYE
jgi:putative ABC transport system permease protein